MQIRLFSNNNIRAYQLPEIELDALADLLLKSSADLKRHWTCFQFDYLFSINCGSKFKNIDLQTLQWKMGDKYIFYVA